MNGQLGFSSNPCHPSPDRGLPALLPSQGGGAGASRSKQAPGREPDPCRGRCPGRGEGRGARPAQDPAPARHGGLVAARVGAATSLSARGPAQEGCEPPRPCSDRTSFFTFHSSFSLTASSALPMVRQAAGGRHQVAPRSPRAPSPPPRLRTQRPTRQAEPRTAALPACSRRSHCPVLSSAAIFRAPQTSGGRPGPFPRPAGRGCVRCDWGGGVKAGADAWGRRARARAAGTVVMATGLLPPRGREPAL